MVDDNRLPLPAAFVPLAPGAVEPDVALTSDPQQMANLYHAPGRQAEVRACREKLRELAAYYQDPALEKIK